MRFMKAFSAGSGRNLQPKSNLFRRSLKIGHLMATILMIFLSIDWPKCCLCEKSS